MKRIAALLFAACTAHAGEAPVLVADSMQAVLELGPERLAEKLGNPSEAGNDRSARIWAAAKRIETEGRLARRSVRRVMALSHLRSALDGWQDLQLEIAFIEAGGGTLWGHQMSRNDATLEEFLAGIAEGVLIEPRAPDGETTKALDALLPAAEKCLGDVVKAAEFMKPDKEQVAAIRKQLEELHGELTRAFDFLDSPETAGKVLGFCREAMEAGKLGAG